MKNVLTISEEEKNRIRGLHLTESKDKRITSILSEKKMGKFDNSTLCFIVRFESGKADKIELPRSGNIVADINFYGRVMRLLMQGMRGDRPFIDIEAGTSGTGSHDRNREVMEERVNQAIEFLLDEVSNFVGPNKLKYSVPTIIDKAKVDRNYSRVEPGSILPTGEEVPTDPNHPFFDDFQYVQICLNPTTKTPGYDSLADQFMEATIRNNLGYSEETVYGILDKLRDKADFEEFSAELERSYGMDFYDIACDTIAKDLTPDWFDKIIGKDPEDEVVFATEIGPGDTTINVHLKRLGVDPISC
jgi:hypothetical protein